MCLICGYHDCTCTPPPRDWKPGDEVLIKATVKRIRWNNSIEVDMGYVSSSGIHGEQVVVAIPLSSIRPIRKEGE